MPERAQSYKPPESMAKVVLYGAFDVAKKTAERHSAAGWNEWIIKKINTIYPTLSPEFQLLIAKHHKGIETGARLAGIGISTAEKMAGFMLMYVVDRKIRRSHYERMWKKDQNIQILRQQYEKAFKPNHKEFVGLVGAIIMMATRIQNNQEPLKKQIIPYGGNHQQRFRAKKTIYESAFIDMHRYEARLYGKPFLVTDEVRRDARASFAQWKKLGYPTYIYLQKLAEMQNKNPPKKRFFWNRLPSFNEAYMKAALDAAQADIDANFAMKHVALVRANQQNEPQMPYPATEKAGKLWRKQVGRGGNRYQRAARSSMSQRKNR